MNKNESIYKGEWDNNEKHGYGEEYFNDGSIYCGNYFRGLKHGKGIFLSSDGSKYPYLYRFLDIKVILSII